MAKKRTTTEQPQSAPQEQPQQPQFSPLEREGLLLGHLIKYNLYLLAKSIVFSSVVGKTKNLKEAALKTNEIILELDLDTKKREEAKASESKEPLN